MWVFLWRSLEISFLGQDYESKLRSRQGVPEAAELRQCPQPFQEHEASLL